MEIKQIRMILTHREQSLAKGPARSHNININIAACPCRASVALHFMSQEAF